MCRCSGVRYSLCDLYLQNLERTLVAQKLSQKLRDKLAGKGKALSKSQQEMEQSLNKLRLKAQQLQQSLQGVSVQHPHLTSLVSTVQQMVQVAV